MDPSGWDGRYHPGGVINLSSARWLKAKASMANGGCVEVAFLDCGEVAVRDSRDQAGPVLIPQPSQWNAFIARAKAGEFDIQD